MRIESNLLQTANNVRCTTFGRIYALILTLWESTYFSFQNPMTPQYWKNTHVPFLHFTLPIYVNRYSYIRKNSLLFIGVVFSVVDSALVGFRTPHFLRLCNFKIGWNSHAFYHCSAMIKVLIVFTVGFTSMVLCQSGVLV